MSEKLTTKEFIEKAKKIHGNKYDYSLVVYKNSKEKIKIICPIHGIFEQNPSSHLQKRGCSKCTEKYMDKKYFKIKAKEIHGNKYNYSLVDYINNYSKVKIICPKHGIFKQMPYAHLNNQGCSKCKFEKIHKQRKLTTEIFIIKAKKIHGDKYNYSMVKYIGNKNKINIICPKHGIFKQTPNAHLHGYSCPICKESQGEKIIRNFLIKNNIKFETQKTFDNCKNIIKLRFDFYLPDYNILIEYDGRQHFKPVNFYGISNERALLTYNKLKENDFIKNQFAKENNFHLIRISYTEKNNIETTLKSYINILYIM